MNIMMKKYGILALVASLFLCVTVRAAGVIDETKPGVSKSDEQILFDIYSNLNNVSIRYEHDKAWPRWDYAQNRKAYEVLVEVVKQISSNPKPLRAIVIEGTASPIGTDEYNQQLALRRAEVLRGILSRMSGGENIRIHIISAGEDWNEFRSYIEEMYHRPNRAKVLEILRKNLTNDEKEALLQGLDGRRTWRLLIKSYMASSRNALVVRIVEIDDLAPKEPPLKFRPMVVSVRPERFVKPPVMEIAEINENLPELLQSLPQVKLDSVVTFNNTSLSYKRPNVVIPNLVEEEISIPSVIKPSQSAVDYTRPFTVAPGVVDKDIELASVAAPKADALNRTRPFVVNPDVVDKDVDLGSNVALDKDAIDFTRPFTLYPDLAEETYIYSVVSPIDGVIAPEGLMPDEEHYLRYPVVALRSNLLVPALNFGVEVPIGNHWSIGADYYFPWIWPKKDNKDCFEFLAWGLEGRYWFGRNRNLLTRLQGHSVAVYGYGGYYDFERNYNGYQGEYANVGLDYTYAMAVGKKKGIHFEFSLGIGYIYSVARKYAVIDPFGPLISEKLTRKIHYFGPTKLNVSLVVPIFKKIKLDDK